MIKSIRFKNFKVLRDSYLPLGRFTNIIGPNGSGKTTAMEGLQRVGGQKNTSYAFVLTAGMEPSEENEVRIDVAFGSPYEGSVFTRGWILKGLLGGNIRSEKESLNQEVIQLLYGKLQYFRLFSLHAPAIASAVTLEPNMQLGTDGSNLAGVLDRLRDQHPERFEALNEELQRWIPEFDKILFNTPQQGMREFLLRTRNGHHSIPAASLSQGTILALAILTVAYLPNPPPTVCFEEPDRGLHPRLLRDVKDAMYRLCYPENYNESREPVQVIATTHSPYMLDLYKDHPDEVVIAQKLEDNVIFEKLSDRSDYEEILQDTHLGDAWYSGIFGGVPIEQ